MEKQSPVKAILSKYPALAGDYFDALHKAGASATCLFGGALRDTDCAHFQGGLKTIAVNDYDMRVWLPASLYQANIDSVVNKLRDQGALVELAPNADTDPSFFDAMKPRYDVSFLGGKMDLSFRAKSDALFLSTDLSAIIAKDRAADSDIGLSAIALDNKMNAWVLPQYLEDRARLTLTIFPTDHDERSLAYAERLKAKKYGHHTIVGPA